MAYLIASVVQVGMLCGVNLLLTFGVVRRLREHADLLAGTPRVVDVGPPVPVGSVVGEFTVTTADGEVVTRDSLDGGTVVGFFSPGCGPCEELLPRFVEYAASEAGGGRRVVAVVAASDAEAGEIAMQLAPVARVVLEGAFGGPVSAAFGVRGYPALCVVDSDGTVTAGGSTVDALPATAQV
jgi:thiol-disulfide isomerase/thioredoxin